MDTGAKAYPVEWTAKDKLATWLDPNRLLGYIFIAKPPFGKDLTLTIDGKSVDG